MLSSEPEFPPRISPCPVSEFFSIEEFAVLSSSIPEPVHEESKLKLLLSSACIALNNTNWYENFDKNFTFGNLVKLLTNLFAFFAVTFLFSLSTTCGIIIITTVLQKMLAFDQLSK